MLNVNLGIYTDDFYPQKSLVVFISNLLQWLTINIVAINSMLWCCQSHGIHALYTCAYTINILVIIHLNGFVNRISILS